MRFGKSEQLLKLALMMQASSLGVGFQDIQEEFQVSRRTAERMRDAIMMLFPHVEEVRIDGKTKHWRLPSGSMNSLMQISAEDLTEMRTAIDILRKENLLHHADNLDKLWLKIKGCIKYGKAASIETDLEALLEAESYVVRAGPRPKIPPHILSILREAIKGFSKVKFTYHSRGKGKTTERIVHPYGFVYGHRHYLLAWCEQAEGLRYFSLPNIADITLLQAPYQKVPSFDLQAYIERSFGVFQEEPYEVKWHFSPAVANEAKEYYFHSSQITEDQPDGSVIVRLTAGGWKEICWHIMTWEGEATILEPAHLREAYESMVNTLLEKLHVKHKVEGRNA